MALTTITKMTDTVSQRTSDNRKLSISPDDVLMGRGARATENEGNVRFRNVVRNRLHDYLTAPRRQDKDQIAREILAVVKSRNGRFLRKVEGMDDSSQGGSDYAAVEDDVALLKVKQALRDQKLEESSNSSQRSGGSKSTRGKGVELIGLAGIESEVLAKEKSEADGFLTLGGVTLPSSVSGVSEALLRMYLAEQASVSAFQQAMLSDAGLQGGLLPSRMGLMDHGLSVAMLVQQVRDEAVLRSAVRAHAIQALMLNPSYSVAGFPVTSHLSPNLTSLEAESRLNLLRSLSLSSPSLGLRRHAAFQEVGDLLNAQRAFKRHKAN